MDNLFVDFCDVDHLESFSPLGESWVVCEGDDPDKGTAILWGFGRKQDAEIAMQFLRSLPVDWSQASNPLWRGLRDLGYKDRRALMQDACERLQW